MNKKVFWAGLITIVILTISGIGLYVYLGVEESKKVSQSLNKNIQIINSNNQQNVDFINGLIAKTEEAATSQNLQEYKTTLAESKTTLDDLIQKTEQEKQNLDKGSNTDTQNFYEQSQKLLDVRKENLLRFSGLTDLSLCYAEKADLLYSWMPEVNQKWANLPAKADVQKITEVSLEITGKIEASLPVLKELPACFEANYKEVLTADIAASTEKKTADYNNLLVSLKKLSSSLNSLNEVEYKSSIEELKGISVSESTYQKTMNDALKTAIEATSGDGQAKIQAQENTLAQLLKEIKSKYRLDTSLEF